MPEVKTVPAQPNVTEATQESRAEAIWSNRTEMTHLQVDLDCVFAREISEVMEVKTKLKALETELDARMSVHPIAIDIAKRNEQENVLKAQYAENFQPQDSKTYTVSTGDKLQVRSSPRAIISDHRKVAEILLQKDLWEAANVTINADVKMLVPLIENGVLQGAAIIEDKRSVALIANKGS